MFASPMLQFCNNKRNVIIKQYPEILKNIIQHLFIILSQKAYCLLEYRGSMVEFQVQKPPVKSFHLLKWGFRYAGGIVHMKYQMSTKASAA